MRDHTTPPSESTPDSLPATPAAPGQTPATSAAPGSPTAGGSRHPGHTRDAHTGQARGHRSPADTGQHQTKPTDPRTTGAELDAMLDSDHDNTVDELEVDHVPGLARSPRTTATQRPQTFPVFSHAPTDAHHPR